MTEHDEFLKEAAQAVESQAAENPLLAIPADPDVAEFMGAFEETAIGPDDFDRDEGAGHD